MTNLEFFTQDLQELDYNGYCSWERKGVTLVVYRHRFGHLCGYAEITDKASIDLNSLHGGVTYQGELDWLDPKFKGKQFLGFDCAHAGDWVPDGGNFYDDVYRDTCFVTYILETCLVF